MLRSTPPLRGATCGHSSRPRRRHVAIHASLAGGDPRAPPRWPPPSGCDPRLPCGRRPSAHSSTLSASRCDPRLPRGRRHPVEAVGHRPRWRLRSTPPSREATRPALVAVVALVVAIHASLAGGDRAMDVIEKAKGVAIHASLAGGDSVSRPSRPPCRCCDPRLPRGRRLCCAWITPCRRPLRSTPPSREATPPPPEDTHEFTVAIHASLAGGDLKILLDLGRDRLRSTPPSREATSACATVWSLERLRSTPPSREATWLPTPYAQMWSCDPRLPRGRRRKLGHALREAFRLRSTPPSREATRCRSTCRTPTWVAIHASLAGGDSVTQVFTLTVTTLRSTPPSREATRAAPRAPRK